MAARQGMLGIAKTGLILNTFRTYHDVNIMSEERRWGTFIRLIVASKRNIVQ